MAKLLNSDIIALASATGEKSPLQTVGVCQCLTQTKPRPSLAEEVPKAPTKARFTEEGEALRVRPRSPGKKFSTKVEKLASAIIHDYVKLKTRLSRKPLS